MSGGSVTPIDVRNACSVNPAKSRRSGWSAGADHIAGPSGNPGYGPRRRGNEAIPLFASQIETCSLRVKELAWLDFFVCSDLWPHITFLEQMRKITHSLEFVALGQG